MAFKRVYFKQLSLLILSVGAAYPLLAQTDMDAIMMNRNQFCNGPMYTHSAWEKYWEGTFKRENLNLGQITTQSVIYMANYGITDKLNVMAALPYVWTNASAGTLHGLSGFQDISVFVKWKAYTRSFGKNKISLFLGGGVSTPVSDYVIDFLPMSIGLGSTNLTGRGMVDYQRGKFTVTGSAAYIWRGNAKLDRDNYYDTEIHLTNEINMPNAGLFQLRTGYRSRYLLAEALVTNWTTFGGFDITKNNMPFPSNRMNATSVGMQAKYTIKQHTNLSVIGGLNYTIDGRNMGQAFAYNAGIFYAFYFNKKDRKN